MGLEASPGSFLMDAHPRHVRGVVGDVIQQVATWCVLYDYRQILTCQEHLRRPRHTSSKRVL